MDIRYISAMLFATVLALILAGFGHAEDQGPFPERVTFMSLDRRTTLVGYLYKPTTMRAFRVPAVVMMHGRAGAYSERANGVYDASPYRFATRHGVANGRKLAMSPSLSTASVRAAIRKASRASATKTAPKNSMS